MEELFILLELQKEKVSEEGLNQEEEGLEINPYTAEIQKMPCFLAYDLRNSPSILEI